MEKEIRMIPGHREYGVTRFGEVFRVSGGKVPMKPLAISKHQVRNKLDPENAYLYVTMLTFDSKDDEGNDINMRCTRPRGVHRLVALAWIGLPPQGKPWVNHIDGKKMRNVFSEDPAENNLEWSSVSENIQHTYDVLGRKCPSGKDSWSFGKRRSKAVKRLMSEKKIGELHPKFKGWYVKDGIEYASAIIASKAVKGASQKQVLRWANKGEKGWSFKTKEQEKT